MARPIENARPHKLNGFWFLIRRVPLEFQSFDTRKLIRASTGIRIVDDPRGTRASKVVLSLHADLLAYWRDKRAGRDREAEKKYAEACSRARALGYSYMPAADAALGLPLDEICARFESLAARSKILDARDVEAVLGGIALPTVMLSRMVDEFEGVVRASLVSKSQRQVTKWRKPKATALDTFVAVVGDKPIPALTREDALKLRSYWQDRVVAGEVQIGTANKNMGHVSSMYRTINESKQLNLPAIFDQTRIRGGRDGQRLAYSACFVQDRILADGQFDDLNPEARRVIFLLTETGIRLSEAINLSKAAIRLDAEIPHICIMPEGRNLKTEQSKRDIPLVGVALEAMRRQPDGFPRYRDKADVLSALVNKALTARKLRPERGQSLYSLRHTFEDRLTAVNAPEKIIACLMGHKWSRPRYGVGPSLAQKRDWLDRICFKAPSKV